MMIRAATAIAAASLLATAANAATVWQGEAVIDSASAACAAIPSAPIRTDTVMKTVLKPKNIAGNDNNTHVSFIANDLALMMITLNHGQMPSGNAAGFGTTASGLIAANVTTAYTQFVQTPATILAGTPNVRLQGRITDFLFVNGCDITFRAAYSKRG